MYATQLEEYKATQKLNMTGREIEVAALMQAARKIKECQSDWNVADRYVRLSKALRDNQTIWSILQGKLVRRTIPFPN